MKPRSVRNLSRISKVVNILIQNGFEGFVSSTGLRSFLSNDRKAPFGEKKDVLLNRWQRIRMVIEELGPTMIKFANYLACRPDILPEPLISEFSHINHVDEPFSKVQAVDFFEKATNIKVDNAFSYFDSTCCFSEGFGRTFRAKLISGEDVAVKVLMPNAETTVQTDITLIRDVVSLIENYLVKHGIVNPLELVNMFEEQIIPELDLRNEANMIGRFKKAYSKADSLIVPKVYTEFSTKETLVTDYYNSLSIKSGVDFSTWGVSRKDTADKFLQTYISGLLQTGVFHSSPRRSVVAVLPNGKISFSDYASTGMLTSDQRILVNDATASLIARNSRVLSESLRKLSVGGEIDDYQTFRTEIQYLADNLFYMEDSSSYMNEFSLGMMRIAYRHKLLLPREVVCAFTSLAAAENVAVSINPDISIAKYFKPYSTKLFMERFSPDRLKSKLNQNISQASDLLENSPLDLSLILKKLRKGEFTANHKIVGMGFFVKKVDTAANKLVYAIMIAALIIGASIITVLGENMYTILGFPVPALIGFALALILSLSLLFYTIRNRFGSRGNDPDGE
ncbi:MAG: AarF/ABC1/UbiB kinase family protein [Bacteroidales bacterium]|nr:AarF/ABC1/UbiB kinase family protein [Bacteroidales bacterium]